MHGSYMYLMYGMYLLPLKTGDIMHMRKQCVPGLSSGGGGGGGGGRGPGDVRKVPMLCGSLILHALRHSAPAGNKDMFDVMRHK